MNTASDSASFDQPSSGHWRLARRLLLLGAALATLVAVLYTVENWRGRRAWETARRALEARGERFDWEAFIPGPVPDAQNFYKAPKMGEWFVRDSWHSLVNSGGKEATNVPRAFALPARPGRKLVVAEVGVARAGQPRAATVQEPIVLRFEEPSSTEQAAQTLAQALGPCLIGARNDVLVARPPEEFKLPRFVLEADTVPGTKELHEFFVRHPPLSRLAGRGNAVYVEAAGTNQFRVVLKDPVYGAAEYLAWTDSLKDEFDLVRQALERPYARIDCDYTQPFGIAIPDFVRIRTVVQMLAERAQCCLLLRRPEQAFQELSLVHGLSQVLTAKPPAKPITLVAAMIRTAVAGLYAEIFKDGLSLHAWDESQLRDIERQLQETDLLAAVEQSLREERAATCRTFEITKRRELVKLFNLGSPPNSWSERLSGLALSLVPQGWFHQNMALGVGMEQELLGGLDPTNHLVHPQRIEDAYREVQPRLQRRSPYTFLVAMSMPNFLRAVQRVAQNQVMVDEARAACALERYRLAQGGYPESLQDLAPRFVEKVPLDVVGGQPLKYRRLPGGGYLMYSIGWDEKDGAGVPGKTNLEGDWAWDSP